ncbi:hypothetical protein PG987_005165 [Apiospora arundinis]
MSTHTGNALESVDNLVTDTLVSIVEDGNVLRPNAVLALARAHTSCARIVDPDIVDPEDTEVPEGAPDAAHEDIAFAADVVISVRDKLSATIGSASKMTRCMSWRLSICPLSPQRIRGG